MKKAINKMKRQLSEWEKIFANEATDKGLISKREQITHAAQYKKYNPIKKWAKDLNLIPETIKLLEENRQNTL